MISILIALLLHRVEVIRDCENWQQDWLLIIPTAKSHFNLVHQLDSEDNVAIRARLCPSSHVVRPIFTFLGDKAFSCRPVIDSSKLLLESSYVFLRAKKTDDLFPESL